ncbi:oxidoreductase [Enterococcus caccae]|uniref:Alcohol dehydrogenase, zinc-containing n=1 Tax=Enterococcus caccae ATCC BAA-1240 TaxID=1158612 RepID=R3TQ60_9ENTE|nr:oxidoreductase [Enterococcus caccae]EOL43679.1 alcohol dehydrogenase, zinc-containing [Enterococcus caccae ATCC BAA-1240]EOT67921.1 alcohol dehydrogenase, zinc-containing [Enterococcus caccae ATCC BAA-1240]
MDMFSAFCVKKEDEKVTTTIEKITLTDLSDGEVIVKVAYSSVNYKDSLAVKQNGGVIRDYPMIPGIDLSGTVLSSEDDRFKEGQNVLVTGYGLGVSHTGGFAEIARVPGDWIVPLPDELSLKEVMIFGTAGFTAALSVQALEDNGLAQNKEATILVTGASGGVGILAIAMLKQLGYKNILALSRKKSAIDSLKKLGATDVLLLDEFMPEKIKPLAKQSIDFVIDTVGGDVTAALLPQLKYGGSIAICGNAAGIKLNTTVLPFILRGTNLLGIDSVNVPMKQRLAIWHRLATDLNVSQHELINEIALQELPQTLDQLQAGTHIGRTIIKMN